MPHAGEERSKPALRCTADLHPYQVLSSVSELATAQAYRVVHLMLTACA